MVILRKWSPYFQRRFGKSLPDNYLSFDLETTGFSKDDLITELGHTIVHDRKVVHRGAVTLDWTRHRVVDQDWLQDRIREVREKMAERGRPYHMTYARMRQDGIVPEKALEFYHALLSGVQKREGFFIGQNIYSFDERVFAAHVLEFCGLEWKFGENEVFDVGAMEKAAQVDLMPFNDESMRVYFRRVQSFSAAGVKWNIEHCVEQYGLAEKHALDLTELHGAGNDSYVVSLLFEEFREKAGLA